MRITNRILTPILSVLILPVTFFLPILRIMISSGLSSGETKVNLLDNFGLGEFISLSDLLSLYKNGAGESNIFTMIWNALEGEKKQEILDMLPGLHWGIIAVVLLVVCVLLAVVLAVVAAATKKPIASMCISAVGIVSALIMNASFDAFAKPFLNGAFDLNTILGNTNQLLSVILGNVASFDYMKLGIAYSAIVLIFVCTLIISLAAFVEQKNAE